MLEAISFMTPQWLTAVLAAIIFSLTIILGILCAEEAHLI